MQPAETAGTVDVETDDSDSNLIRMNDILGSNEQHLVIERLSECMNLHDPERSRCTWPYQQAARRVTGYDDWRERIDQGLRAALRRNRGWEERRNGLVDLLWSLRCVVQHLNSAFDKFFTGETLWSKRGQVFEYYMRLFPQLWRDVNKVLREAEVLNQYASRCQSEQIFTQFCYIVYALAFSPSRPLYESELRGARRVGMINFAVNIECCDWVVQTFFSIGFNNSLGQRTQKLARMHGAYYIANTRGSI